MSDLELEIMWLDEIHAYLAEQGQQVMAMHLAATIRDKKQLLLMRLQEQVDDIQQRIAAIKEANEL